MMVDAVANLTRLSSICPSLVLVDVGINPMLSLFPQFPHNKISITQPVKRIKKLITDHFLLRPSLVYFESDVTS